MNKILKVIIKYISLAIVGAVLFAAASPIANASRPAASIGGEAFFLALPLFWWLIDETLKDFERAAKSEQVNEQGGSEQVSKENTRDSPVETEQK